MPRNAVRVHRIGDTSVLVAAVPAAKLFAFSRGRKPNSGTRVRRDQKSNGFLQFKTERLLHPRGSRDSKCCCPEENAMSNVSA